MTPGAAPGTAQITPGSVRVARNMRKLAATQRHCKDGATRKRHFHRRGGCSPGLWIAATLHPGYL
ncbi:MAG: hypothetical protein AMXMBFR52_00910 [Burkholderiales bacterium]